MPIAAISSVVPRAGTWIETVRELRLCQKRSVVPRAGTWIETLEKAHDNFLNYASFPVRERGLKHKIMLFVDFFPLCRSPCGNVD